MTTNSSKPASSAMADILGPSYVSKKKKSAEPISGVQGAGTPSEPYDQGNQAAQDSSRNEPEPVNGVQGRGTREEPFDGGNQDEQDERAGLSVNGNGSGSGNGNGVAKANEKDKDRLSPEDARGRSTEKWPTRVNTTERSVSPGQLADGSHVRTSGDNGQSYQPGGRGLGKLKNRMHIGSSK